MQKPSKPYNVYYDLAVKIKMAVREGKIQGDDSIVQAADKLKMTVDDFLWAMEIAKDQRMLDNELR